MSLEEKISNDIKAAMLARNAEKLEALRAVKAAILLEKTKEGGAPEMTEATELRILQKLVKQRKESAGLYRSGNREDLAVKELFEASIIETYLPQQMGPEELTARIREIIETCGATTIKEMGKVMGIATRELAGKADNKSVSEVIRKLLGGV
jgi:uncharacterized protein YqeY